MVEQLIQELVTQVLHYQPDDPLDFIARTLDDMCEPPDPLVSAVRRIELTANTDLFLDEVSHAYTLLSTRRGYATGLDVTRLVAALGGGGGDAPQLPDDEPCDFDKFCACCYCVFNPKEDLDTVHAAIVRRGLDRPGSYAGVMAYDALPDDENTVGG